MEDNTSNLRVRALAVLRKFYGYDNFFPIQYQVIEHVMQGEDALVLMPTGGGKSMCYQVPALLKEGCAIVVSPLLALMKDQVDSLLACGIPAASINSQQSEAENREVIEQVYRGTIKLLYVSPERLLTEIEEWSQKMKISLVAIDEAHCISQWGHDFRPEYTQLAILKQRFPHIPFLALTATADKLTRADIILQLGMPKAQLFITSFDRPNISLEVQSGVSGKQKVRRIAQFIAQHRGESGIVYCLSRKNTETMASKLQGLGIKAMAFHAGLPTEQKMEIQRAFINDEVLVICATIAFGMGIDKSNVRWVIHSNMPKNMESYYQEIGRAGRDGAPAHALMFYSFGDVVTLMKFAQDSGQSATNIDKLRRMQHYAEATVCRRRVLLSYFNERYEQDCGYCDVCQNPPERFDGSVLVQMALSAALRTGEQAGLTSIIDILRGARKAELLEAGWNKLKTYGVGHDLSFAMWNHYLLQMLQLGIIDVAYDEHNHIKVTPYGREILFGKATIELSKFEYKQLTKPSTKKKQSLFDEATWAQSDEDLFLKLKESRLALARAAGIAPYMVFSDKVLRHMVTEKPTTKLQFDTLYGVGEHKSQLYWRHFTSLIAQWLSQHDA